ncbi:hypothetical protein MIMGU_mgv1a017382mg [Erythranthe guttata]|uniref:Uncharacterized protein n=1 Tax=Erythranthe guttata TaxID=4155 RepID=A0A022QJ70_ERYGU|nr:hypothetical protein MIMGU_mgv1a017382mg [Erythranthe guttata]
MASLVLLVSELLRHENVDSLISSSSSSTSTAAGAPPSAASRVAASKTPRRILPARCKNGTQDQLQEELPRICVDLVWP